MPIKWKLKSGTTWREKLTKEHPNHGKVAPIPVKMRKRFGTGTILIPRPIDVDAVIKTVRKGKLITSSQIRERLAKAAGATCSCPLTTGIFIKIAAEAAEEALAEGKKRVTPYWRAIKDDGKLNDKFPGGAKAQAKNLRGEGFTITPGRGQQPPKVKEFEKYLVD